MGGLLRRYPDYALPYRAVGSLTVTVSGYFELESGLEKAIRLNPTADRMELAWLSGLKESFVSLRANRLLVLRETKGILSSRRLR
jgi:hypothetical protein